MNPFLRHPPLKGCCPDLTETQVQLSDTHLQRPGRLDHPLQLGAWGEKQETGGNVIHLYRRVCILKGSFRDGERGQGGLHPYSPDPSLSLLPGTLSALQAFWLISSTSVFMKTWHRNCERFPIPVLIHVIYTFRVSVDVMSPK